MTVNIEGLGKITASKEILNLISSLAYEARENYAATGYKAWAVQAKEVAEALYDALDEIGFYDKYK